MLPPTIQELGALVYLSLAGNRLTALPTELWQMASLKNLYLTGNQLAERPPGIEYLDMEVEW